jgi:hypothetical protein
MQWGAWAITQLLSYGLLTWLALGLIAFFAARVGGLRGVIVGQILIALVVATLDIRWIQTEMGAREWDASKGPDMDVIFGLGVTLRVVLINCVLVPVSALGMCSRRFGRQQRVPAERDAAGRGAGDRDVAR